MVVGCGYHLLLGYSTMCGHAVLSLGRYAIDYKLVKPVSPETRVNIQCPCGPVVAYVKYDSGTGQTGSVRFESVPSFAFAVDKTIKVGKWWRKQRPLLLSISLLPISPLLPSPQMGMEWSDMILVTVVHSMHWWMPSKSR